MTKLAIVGAHNCGKTTCFYHVASQYKINGRVIGLVHETARDCPYPLNMKGGFLTQWWILSRQIEREAREQRFYDKILCDRSVFDIVVYAQSLFIKHKMSVEEYHVLTDTAMRWADNMPYTIILFLKPLTLEKDAARGKNTLAYQNSVNKLFEDLMKLVDNSYCPVIEISERDKRLRPELVMQHVRNYFGKEV